ncbi:hypothetical protein [Nguyenibacter vanlangensis]|uniref:Uncharacterized protein n=1 Tax=Nguyenibacter vanlangensis TaxID=1216886 RepID=A0A7Y7ITM5_9PROT|nr:hypothetical protein [Nguyenibacter vanlangensis]NVN10154.1 hypothetical protein [Nguyenibacter vanlangensis]
MIRFYFHPTPNPAKVALNGKVPAIPLYLAEKTGRFLGVPEDRPELLSWLLFIASGLGPFSGQAVHFHARQVGTEDSFKSGYNEKSRRALFPSNYPPPI